MSFSVCSDVHRDMDSSIRQPVVLLAALTDASNNNEGFNADLMCLGFACFALGLQVFPGAFRQL